MELYEGHNENDEDFVRLRRRVETLRKQFSTPPTREQLVALVWSIDYSKASSSEEIEDIMARDTLYAESVPHPNSQRLLERVWHDQDMSAEDAVEEAISWKVPDLFCLPGSLNSDWSASSETGTGEP